MEINNWKFNTSCIEGEPVIVDGLNLWEFKWKDTGKRVHIKDPRYGEDHTFNIFEITNESKVLRFAAGEFSNMVWGIYVEH